jgi:hypothetical protein
MDEQERLQKYLEETITSLTKEEKPKKAVSIYIDGKICRINGKTVWSSIGAAKSALRNEFRGCQLYQELKGIVEANYKLYDMLFYQKRIEFKELS